MTDALTFAREALYEAAFRMAQHACERTRIALHDAAMRYATLERARRQREASTKR